MFRVRSRDDYRSRNIFSKLKNSREKRNSAIAIIGRRSCVLVDLWIHRAYYTLIIIILSFFYFYLFLIVIFSSIKECTEAEKVRECQIVCIPITIYLRLFHFVTRETGIKLQIVSCSYDRFRSGSARYYCIFRVYNSNVNYRELKHKVN